MSPQKNLIVTVEQARRMHQQMVVHMMTGPGDSEMAMHRIEDLCGLDYWQQWSLRHRRRATQSFLDRIRLAYLHVLKTSIQKDLHELCSEVSATSNLDDAYRQRLVAQAQDLLSRADEALAKP